MSTFINAKKVFSMYIKNEKNINVIINSLNKLYEKNKSTDDKTNNTLKSNYIMSVIHNLEKGVTPKEVNEIIKEDKLCFKSKAYENLKQFIEEHNGYLINPFEVSEGMMTCPKCKSKKTISRGKQDRCGDEAMSVYSQCYVCKYSWRENN